MSDEKTPTTVIRCVTIPVSVPLGDDPDGKPWTWAALDARLDTAFRLSTDLSNWCVRRLFVLDDPTSAACPEAVKKWYGYKDASEHYPGKAQWAGAMAGLNLVTRAVQRKYVQQRFDVMVRNVSALLTYRFPQPYPVHNQNWSLDYAEGGFPVCRVSVPGVGQVDLRLKRSSEFGRQLALIRRLHDGTAKKGEAALYRNGKGDLLLKMVGHFPRVERAATVNAAFVHTDPAALLVVEINGRRANVTNADHVRREVAKDRSRSSNRNDHAELPEALLVRGAAHAAFRQRAYEDKKREVRMDRRQRSNFDAAIADRCEKQNHRVDTAVKQIAAQVARMCERNRVGVIGFDGSNKEFFPNGFPWHALETRLKQLLVGEMGCEWYDGTYSHAETPGAVLERSEWLQRARAAYQVTKKATAHKSRPSKKPHPAVSTPRRKT